MPVSDTGMTIHFLWPRSVLSLTQGRVRGIRSAGAEARSILPADNPTGTSTTTKDAAMKVMPLLLVLPSNNPLTAAPTTPTSSKNVSANPRWSPAPPVRSASAMLVTANTPLANATPSWFPVMPSRTVRAQPAAESLNAVPAKHPSNHAPRLISASALPATANTQNAATPAPNTPIPRPPFPTVMSPAVLAIPATASSTKSHPIPAPVSRPPAPADMTPPPLPANQARQLVTSLANSAVAANTNMTVLTVLIQRNSAVLPAEENIQIAKETAPMPVMKIPFPQEKHATAFPTPEKSATPPAELLSGVMRQNTATAI